MVSKSSSQKLVIWMNMPSHHQMDYFNALRKEGIDVLVLYYGRVKEERLSQGWHDISDLHPGECYVSPTINSLDQVADWRERIHIIPGYGNMFLRKLVRYLSRERVRWFHWSESARSGFRWWATYPLKKWYAHMVNAYASGALAIGKLAKEDFIRWGIKDSKIHFLPYATKALTFDARKVSHEIAFFGQRGGVRFLYIGSLYRGKGIDVLIRSFKNTVELNKSTRLILVGKDYSRGKYNKMVRDLDIEEYVRFRPPVSFDEIGNIVAACDVLVLPSRYDGWGMPLNEAASVGKALIGSDACGAAHHLIHHEYNGYRVISGSIESLSYAMKEYIKDPTLIEKHGNASLKIFEDYTPDKNVIRLKAAIATVSYA